MSPILLILIATLAAIVVLALLNKARFARRVDARLIEEAALAERAADHRVKLKARIEELRQRAEAEMSKNTDEADEATRKHIEQAERLMSFAARPTVSTTAPFPTREVLRDRALDRILAAGRRRVVTDVDEKTGPGRPLKPVAEPQEPAVNPKKSVFPDYIVCLEDGMKFKSLKRHLAIMYKLTPDAYRAKWGLPHDYPMIAPNYAATRSALAKKVALGRKAAPVARASAQRKAKA